MRRLPLLPLLGLLVVLLASPVGAQVEEEVDWFKGGWYVGASAGFANSGANGQDLDSALAALGYATTSDLDDTDHGAKVFVGYRADRPFGVELGFTSLGEVESTIAHMATDVPAFLEAVAGVHPFSAQGVTLSGVYYLVDRPRVSVRAHGGLWGWRSNVDVRAAGGERVDVDEDGVDPFLGIGVLVDLTDDLLLRAEYEKYAIDDADVDLFSLGIQLRFL